MGLSSTFAQRIAYARVGEARVFADERPDTSKATRRDFI
jgi:hypothetical protein